MRIITITASLLMAVGLSASAHAAVQHDGDGARKAAIVEPAIVQPDKNVTTAGYWWNGYYYTTCGYQSYWNGYYWAYTYVCG